jgi:hypothetical protein
VVEDTDNRPQVESQVREKTVMDIISTIIGLTAVSFCVERTVEYVFLLTPLGMIDKKYSPKVGASLVIGAAVGYFSKIDVIGMFLSTTGEAAWTSVMLTAVVLAGGSNVFSDLMKVLKTVKENATGTVQ